MYVCVYMCSFDMYDCVYVCLLDMFVCEWHVCTFMLLVCLFCLCACMKYVCITLHVGMYVCLYVFMCLTLYEMVGTLYVFVLV